MLKPSRIPSCSLCHQDVMPGDKYWYCNGTTVCQDCFASYARGAFAPYCLRCGQEVGYDH